MKRLLFVLFVLLAVVTPCFAKTAERLTNLPQDQDMWYVSVVGDGPQYETILGWFDEAPLKSLKEQVHFCPVTTDSAVYKERYKPNVKALPTVRVQEADGTLVYEVSGKDVPQGAETLHASLSAAIDAGALRLRRNRQRPAPVEPPKPVFPPILPVPPPVIHTPPVGLTLLAPRLAAFGVLVMALAIGFGMAQTKGKT